MAKRDAPFPTKAQILDFIRDSPTPVGKREIARAFRLNLDQKIALKAVLRDLKTEGGVERGHGKRIKAAGTLPPVAMLIYDGLTDDGDAIARPAEWREDSTPPAIYLRPIASDKAPLGTGQHFLARLKRQEDGSYEASFMNLVGAEANQRLVGTYYPSRSGGGGRVEIADRRARHDIMIAAGDTNGAEAGELVTLESFGTERMGPKRGRITERLGDASNPKAISLIAIVSRDIPTAFMPESIVEAETATIPPLGNRTDLQDLPLVTIDGEDARDFDDAVWAEPDTSADNKGGWHIVVAIADVAHYVRPGSALDRDAFTRGNSVYFPDRVVPMLPEALSNGLCSLRPHEPRACLAIDMRISRQGQLLSHKLRRGLMRSVARLTYNQVQAARNGGADETTQPLMASVIEPLYGAYESLLAARHERGTLELDLPERQVKLSPEGKVLAIIERTRLDSHRLIEEFMIAANVAAAEMLETAKHPGLYRIHDRPDPTKLDAVRDFIRDLGLSLPKGQVIQPSQLTKLLVDASGTPHSQLVSDVVLRSQAQAMYSPDNIGHFGLALRRYAHFTSPIRRYADLIVHRALISLYRLGDDGLAALDGERLQEIGEHISVTERRAAEAERDATSRYTAAYMSSHIGSVFSGRISGVSRFGLFVRLDQTGAEGLIPISTLPDDFYVHDEKHHSLIGRRRGRSFRLADPITVKLREADPITGSTLFSLLDGDGDSRSVKLPTPGKKQSFKPPRAKAGHKKRRG